jgi:glycerol-3-phosphate dehydrogenase
MPRDGWVMIGTTDTDFDGDRERLAAKDADIEYLLGVVNRALPNVGIGPDDVAYSFAGLRALPLGASGKSPSQVRRDEVTIESGSGMISIAGGKLTTHREIAEKIVDNLMRRLGRPTGHCPTRDTPLPGARNREEKRGMVGDIPSDIATMLASRYGTRAAMVTSIIGEYPELAARIVPGAPAIQAEVVHAIRSEMATSISDFLVRRTSMVWRDPASAISSAPEVARIMGAELGWNGERVEAELRDFYSKHALRDVPIKPGARSIANESDEVADGGVAIK